MLLLHITKLVCIRNTRLVYSLYAYIKLDSIVICYVSYLPSCVRIYVYKNLQTWVPDNRVLGKERADLEGFKF